jgi:hypothetical protein
LTVFKTQISRVRAPLLGQLLQLSHPAPSQELHESQELLQLSQPRPSQDPHFFLSQGKQLSPFSQGKTTRGMQITLESTSKQVFSSSPSFASRLQV